MKYFSFILEYLHGAFHYTHSHSRLIYLLPTHMHMYVQLSWCIWHLNLLAGRNYTEPSANLYQLPITDKAKGPGGLDEVKAILLK